MYPNELGNAVKCRMQKCATTPHKAIIVKKKKKENKQKYQRYRIKIHKLEEIKIRSIPCYHQSCTTFLVYSSHSIHSGQRMQHS